MSSSLIAAYDSEMGVLQTTTTSGDSLTSSSSSNNSVVDSDTFLTLLMAEMQNQDPLEPTSNTEWVSQYATFTQVEQMSEMADSIDLLRANELVGKDVIMKVTSSSTGNVTYTRGKVEYASIENGNAILVIDGNKYSLSDLDSVISDEYSEAYDLYTEFVANIDSLPDVKYADLSYADKITQLYEQYNFEMDDYQKNFMVTYASSEVDTLVNWVSALGKLGVEFKTEEEASTTLDDVLLSFNTNMTSILDRLDLLSTQVQASASSSGTTIVNNTVVSDTATTNTAEANTTATTGTSTVVENVSSSQTDNSSDDDTDNTEEVSTEVASTEQVDNSDSGDVTVSDEIIEALTADTETEETSEETSSEETTTEEVNEEV